jgi:hypothetical protein
LNQEYFNVHECKRIIRTNLNSIQDTLVESDVVRMQASTKMRYFKHIKTHCNIEEIMKTNVAWHLKVLSVHLRANIPRIVIKNTTTNLNSLKLYFDGAVDLASLLSTLYSK